MYRYIFNSILIDRWSTQPTQSPSAKQANQTSDDNQCDNGDGGRIGKASLPGRMKRYVIALACAFACYMVLQAWVETVSHQVAQSRAGTHADRTSQGLSLIHI